METNTLFSLELAVETLRVNSQTIVCRLPAVAFRLLDFPTLLVHHVDPGEAQNIKEKILMDSFGEIPNRLNQLCDHRGNFCVNKCKSCLFKMDPETLLAYLKNTPLYVMLIDVWPEVPRLVANCTVTLQQTMEEIMQDIERDGVGVPSVHGKRDSYKLYNLMGHEVGWVLIRYRLLSMGASLIPHIPEAAIAKRRNDEKDAVVKPPTTSTADDEGIAIKTKTRNKEGDVILEDLEVHGHSRKTISVAVSTQTTTCAKVRHHVDKTSRRSDSLPRFQTDDLVAINNIRCPPPLFYNTGSDDQDGLPRQQARLIRHSQVDVDKFQMDYVITHSDFHGDVLSSTLSSTTLSEEEVHHIETKYSLPNEDDSIRPCWSVCKTDRTSTSKKEKEHKRTQAEKQIETRLAAQTVDENVTTEENIHVCNKCQQPTQLPILAALLQELSLLHGNTLHQCEPARTLTPIKTIVPLNREPQTTTSAAMKERVDVKIKPHIVARETSKPYRAKHKDCTKPTEVVPPTKGWLRQQPVHGKRKSKLHYTMTHTQKLRLKRYNPELLKEMERRESLREEAKMGCHRRQRKKDSASGGAAGKHDAGEEERLGNKKQDIQAVHHQLKSYQKKYVQKGDDKRKYDLPGTTFDLEHTEGDGMVTTKGNQGQLLDDGEEDASSGYINHAKERGSNSPKLPKSRDVSESDTTVRSHDVHVYLPSASVQDTSSESGADSVIDAESDPSMISTQTDPIKTIQIPGLPSSIREVPSASPQACDPSSDQYSDDFVGSDSDLLEEPELQPGVSTDNTDDSYRSGSYSSSSSTTQSQRTQVAAKQSVILGQLPSKKPTDRPVKSLSIPKPKLSSISPLPARRASKASTNTAALFTSDSRKTERSVTPPTPKPRLSLLRSTSSEPSVLQSTVPSSEFKTEDSRILTPSSNKGESELYSDDFINSDGGSDSNDTF